MDDNSSLKSWNRGVCRLCGSCNTEIIQTKSDGILYSRCLACSYTSRNPEDSLSPEAEKKRYQLHNNSPDNQGYVDWINRFLDFSFRIELPARSRILDFGSGPEPVMAAILEKRGYQVFTEDPFFSPEIPGGLFHLITSLEVFEHISNPAEVLKNLTSRLSEDGRLCISTEFLPSDDRRFDLWRYRSDETHIGFFSVGGLTEAAEKAGLEKENCDGVRYISFRLAHR